MISKTELIAAAMSHVGDLDLRMIIDSELNDTPFEASKLHLVLAADLICDAALEVVTEQSAGSRIKKTVVLDQETSVDFLEMAIVDDLKRMYEQGGVTKDTLQALSLRSATASAISQALEAGMTADDLTHATIPIVPMGLARLLAKQAKPRGLFRRMFGRS